MNALIEARKSNKVMTGRVRKSTFPNLKMSQDSGNPANLGYEWFISVSERMVISGPGNLNPRHMIVDSVTSIYDFKLVKGPRVLKSLKNLFSKKCHQISMVKHFKLVWAAVSSMRNHGGQQINLVDNKSGVLYKRRHF